VTCFLTIFTASYVSATSTETRTYQTQGLLQRYNWGYKTQASLISYTTFTIVEDYNHVYFEDVYYSFYASDSSYQDVYEWDDNSWLNTITYVKNGAEEIIRIEHEVLGVLREKAHHSRYAFYKVFDTYSIDGTEVQDEYDDTWDNHGLTGLWRTPMTQTYVS